MESSTKKSDLVIKISKKLFEEKCCDRQASILNILKCCEREASILNILMKYLNKILWEAGKYSKFQFNSKISCFPAFYSEPLVNILFRRMIIFFVIIFNILARTKYFHSFRTQVKSKFESWTMFKEIMTCPIYITYQRYLDHKCNMV